MNLSSCSPGASSRSSRYSTPPPATTPPSARAGGRGGARHDIRAAGAAAIGQDDTAILEVVYEEFRWQLDVGLAPGSQASQVGAGGGRPAVVHEMRLVDRSEMLVAF